MSPRSPFKQETFPQTWGVRSCFPGFCGESCPISCNLPIIELILYYSTLSSYYYNYHYTLNHSETAEIDERKRAINGSSKVKMLIQGAFIMFLYGHVHSSLRILVNISGPIKRHGVVDFVTLWNYLNPWWLG